MARPDPSTHPASYWLQESSGLWVQVMPVDEVTWRSAPKALQSMLMHSENGLTYALEFPPVHIPGSSRRRKTVYVR